MHAAYTKAAAGVRFPVELLLLGGVAAALPMFEGIKNYLLVLYVIAWYANRLPLGLSWASVGGRWDGWDTIFTLALAAAPAGAALAGLHGHEWPSVVDTLRIVGIAWFLKRSGYGATEWRRLHVTLQAAATIACAWALADLAWPHDYEGIQLNSVGHVNQSAIYIVVCFGALIGGVAAYWRTMSRGARAAAVVALAVQLTALFAAGSRAGAATAIVGAVAFALFWRKRSRAPLVWTAVAIAVFGVWVATLDTDMRRKQEFALDSPNPFLNERYPIWQQALAAWRAFPLAGIGGDNFSAITAADVASWSQQRGVAYDKRTFVPISHAHSLYFNTLAEHGLIGAAALFALMAGWAWTVVRDRPGGDAPPVAWLVWSGAASALVVTLALGAFNTTLHDEHGLLAAMLLGMWLGYRLRARAGAADDGPDVGTRRPERADAAAATV